MTSNTLRQAQAYLTVNHQDRVRRIVDIRILLRNHELREILDFMKELFRETEKKLKYLMTRDVTNPEIDRLVPRLWRIYMSIAVLEKEVMREDGPERGAGEGRRLSIWDSGGNLGRGEREDANPHGEDY